jgi:hypothetical protein
MNNEKIYHLIKLRDYTIKAATSLPASLAKYITDFYYVKSIIVKRIEKIK